MTDGKQQFIDQNTFHCNFQFAKRNEKVLPAPLYVLNFTSSPPPLSLVKIFSYTLPPISPTPPPPPPTGNYCTLPKWISNQRKSNSICVTWHAALKNNRAYLMRTKITQIHLNNHSFQHCKCKFNVKHRECLHDHPSQRLMINCLTIPNGIGI